jgi:hypothetical protein
VILIDVASFAQNNKYYPELSKYSHWSIIAGPAIYNKAKLYPEYGEYTFENRPIWSFNAGFEYDFIPDGKWSFTTGIIVGYEPVYSIELRIKNEDIYPHFTEDWVDETKSYAIPSFSFPLLARLNIQVNKKMFAFFTTGLRAFYFPPGEASLSWVFHNEDMTESREVFGMRMVSPDNAVQGSFEIGTGLIFPINKVLLKSKIIYVMNFQNIMEGEYLFDNMFVSPRSYGQYELSGNYLTVLFSVSLKKSKRKQNI